MGTNAGRALLAILLGLACMQPAAGQSAQQRAWLQERAQLLLSEQQQERLVAETEAARHQLPVRQVRADGRVLELQRFVDGLPIYYLTQNLDEARAVSADRLWSGGGAGFALSGAGERVGLWDGGIVLASHRELEGRTVKGDKAYTVSSHATHVAGTIAAAGIDAAARGVAFEASLQSYDFSQDRAEMALAAAAGLRVSNHSYGQALGWVSNLRGDGYWGWLGDTSVDDAEDYRFGFYDWMAAEWDAIAYNAPGYLIVKAAGNDRGEGAAPGEAHWALDRTLGKWVLTTTPREKDGGADGYDTIIDAGNAKNVLTVGAASRSGNGYDGPEDIVMTSFSGWGPTDDGRIKPDLVADGVDVYSLSSTSTTAYASMSGTSSAAPVVTGALALLMELERSLSGGASFRSSTFKALLIHTADEAGTSPGPDYRFGWGMVNAYRAAQVMEASFREEGNALIRELPLTDAALEVPVYADGSEPLRVTIAWIDPPGTAPQPAVDPKTPMLVDDLDVRIVDEQGNVYEPWVLDPAQPSAPAKPGDNVRDNVEQVVIAAPVPGRYLVRITHKGSLRNGRQDVSLVVSGASAHPPASPAVTLESTVFLQGAYEAPGRMRNTLQASGWLPTAQPYGGAPWHYTGDEALSAGEWADTTAIVDWVLVQLRTAPAVETAIATRAALLLRDGRIAGVDGQALRFDDVSPGHYYVVVRHRNHLPVMSAAPVDFTSGSARYDFSAAPSQGYGFDPMVRLADGRYGLYAGDADGNGQIQNSDKNSYWWPSVGKAGYEAADFNLNGQVQNDDKNLFWWVNIGRGVAF